MAEDTPLLPVSLIKRIVRLADDDRALVRGLLAQGRILSEVARSCLYHTLILPDNDRLLLLAKDAEAPSSCLKTILSRHVYANEVRSLHITTCEEDSEAVPLDAHELAELLEQLTRLETFIWATSRTPPRRLARVISTMSRLRGFTFSLAGDVDLRYDGQLFDRLPTTITRLAVADLSQMGVKLLDLSLLGMTNLQSLRIERTRFVDDGLMRTLAGCIKLQKFVLVKMDGTKLTDIGIANILDSSSLIRLELIDVQGRLSRSCWSKVSPRALKALLISYSEDGEHHSWVTHHLESIASIFDEANLTEFGVARIVPPEALQPGGHIGVPLDPLMDIRPLPVDLIRLLVRPRTHLKKLDIDFWQTSLVDLHHLLLNCRGLEHLKVLIDQSFSKLMMLPTPLAALPRLRELILTIPPVYTLFLKDVYKDIGSEDKRPTAQDVLAEAQKDGTVPSIKDFRKFIKKASSLELVKWTGRGGICTYELRKTSSVLPKIFLKPVTPFKQSKLEGTWCSQGVQHVPAPLTRPPRTPSPVSEDEDGASTPPLSTAASTTPASSSPPRMRRMPSTLPSPHLPSHMLTPTVLAPIGEKKSPGWGRARTKPSSPKTEKEKDAPRKANDGNSVPSFAKAGIAGKGVTSSPATKHKKSDSASSRTSATPSKSSNAAHMDAASPSPRRTVPGMATSGKKKSGKRTTSAATGSPTKRAS